MHSAKDPVIDRQALDRHTMGNVELQRELFMLFFDQTPVYLDQLEDAVKTGDAEAWRMAAHGIKGSSRALGFVRLAVLSRECEIVAPSMEMLAKLRDAVEATRIGLEQEVAA